MSGRDVLLQALQVPDPPCKPAMLLNRLCVKRGEQKVFPRISKDKEKRQCQQLPRDPGPDCGLHPAGAYTWF